MATIIVLIALIALAIWLSLPTLFHGAVYLGMKQERVEDMVKAARVTAGMRVADFGSGDGRVVIAFARAGAEAHGYEIDPLFVFISRWKIRRAGLADRATIHWQSFWSSNAGDYDLITLFGFDTFMKRLQSKLLAELRPGARAICYVYQFPKWKPIETIGRLAVYEQKGGIELSSKLL